MKACPHKKFHPDGCPAERVWVVQIRRAGEPLDLEVWDTNLRGKARITELRKDPTVVSTTIHPYYVRGARDA